ncbi:helix-turn-helix transcriptional regulator [Aliarcobacter butzleri]|uniref:helix-turn-helix domain-containing protein n=1 Tax=Aliarcobacter butzleri TaxID=28197 RepID=UPI00263C1C28|nr:helix-turn-helix transcriptional regulator [Aliarcobacter butzleri]MDN5047930.1 helix-turn-helix transcriptional regulator [Aliarcobacter butzleri]
MKNEQDKLLLEELAKSIKNRRLQLGISQERLAEKCAFDRTYISMLERAKRNPSYLNLLKLCQGLDISLEELLSKQGATYEKKNND